MVDCGLNPGQQQLENRTGHVCMPAPSPDRVGKWRRDCSVTMHHRGVLSPWQVYVPSGNEKKKKKEETQLSEEWLTPDCGPYGQTWN